MADWSRDKEKKIMTKYRFTLTYRVVKVLIAALFLFWVYMMAVTISYDSLHLDRKHIFYTQLAMDWTQPNIHKDFGGIAQSEITPFFTQKISYPVTRRVGKEEQPAGEMHIKKGLLNSYSTRALSYYQPDQGGGFRFYFPENPKTGEKLEAGDGHGVWETLGKVHEGTVAEAAFSTERFMDPEELFALLAPYDLDVLWMPLYTGELKTFKGNTGSGGNSISPIPAFGLTGGREISDDRMSESEYEFTQEMLGKNKELMLGQMEKLLKEERKSYYENFLGLGYLEKRHAYLEENGFQVYGAVVTGPVKELLKLKEIKELRGEQLGEMEYWNWAE
jgi:hypothetical protein